MNEELRFLAACLLWVCKGASWRVLLVQPENHEGGCE